MTGLRLADLSATEGLMSKRLCRLTAFVIRVQAEAMFANRYMKIIYRTGDLLAAPEKVLCHGCNAQGKMGAGIAVAIRKSYPAAFTEYRRLYEDQSGRLELGQCVFVSCDDGRTIIDAVTQEFYGRDPGIVYVDYDGVRLAMQRINVWAKGTGVNAVAFPKIGAGLANGDWNIIAAILEDEARDFQPVVYTL